MTTALILGILSAIVPPLVGLITQIAARERQPRDLHRLTALAAVRKDLPSGSASASSVDELIITLAAGMTAREKDRRPLNPTNVGLTLVLSAAGGFGSYLLVVWALSGSSLTWLAWSLFAVVLLFTLLLMAAGIGTFRNPPTEKAQKTNEDAAA
jgi:hypothetical protein